MAPSQEDEWEQMIHQDPHSGLIAGDSGHGMMTAMKNTESMEETEELTGAVGGVKESTSVDTSRMSSGKKMTLYLCLTMIMLQNPRPPPPPQPLFKHKKKAWFPLCSIHLSRKSLASGKLLWIDY